MTESKVRERASRWPVELSDRTPEPTLTAQHNASDRAGNRVDVRLLTVNDVYTFLPDDNGNGGFAQLPALLKEERRGNCVFSVNGDVLSGSALLERFKVSLQPFSKIRGSTRCAVCRASRRSTC